MRTEALASVIEKHGPADSNGHITRLSDSSLYDEKCVLCGATDGRGDTGLERPCPENKTASAKRRHMPSHPRVGGALEGLRALVAQCRFPGLELEVDAEDEPLGRYFLRVSSRDARCNVSGRPMSWKGRKWRLSLHMTDGEVVQTAFKAILTAIEHEAREAFTFMGTPVFDPHYDIYKLVALRQQADALAEREPHA